MLCQATISTQEELTAFIERFEKVFKAIRELAKGLGAACGELYQARLDRESSRAQATVLAEKAAVKRGKQIAAQDAADAKKRGTASAAAVQDRPL
jgi:hypothetical protein